MVETAIHSTSMPFTDVKWCTVALSDVIGADKRLEAAVYDIDSREAARVATQGKYPSCNLIGEGLGKRAYYGARLKRRYVPKTSPEAIGFIGSSEMLDINPVPVKYMNRNNPDAAALKLTENVLLLSRSGTIGNLTMVNKTISQLLVSEHAIRLECDSVPGYVYCYLNSQIGQTLIKSKVFGAVIQEIEPDHLTEIPIPDPPEEIKNNINGLILRSFGLRDESNDLLNKASAMLIAELSLPPIHDFVTDELNDNAGISSYSVKLSELAGRFDGSYHTPVVKAIINHLNIHAAEVTVVGDKRISKSVVLPGRFKRVYVAQGQGRAFIGGKQLFELDPSGKKYLSLAHHSARIKSQLELSENMTLITCSGTIGKVTLVPRHWEHWAASQHIIRIVPASEDISGYICVFLATDYGRELITRYTYGSVVDEIDDRHVSQIPFPLLKNTNAQSEINSLALSANKLRYQAFTLEQEAMKIMYDEVLFPR